MALKKFNRITFLTNFFFFFFSLCFVFCVVCVSLFRTMVSYSNQPAMSCVFFRLITFTFLWAISTVFCTFFCLQPFDNVVPLETFLFRILFVIFFVKLTSTHTHRHTQHRTFYIYIFYFSCFCTILYGRQLILWCCVSFYFISSFCILIFKSTRHMEQRTVW